MPCIYQKVPSPDAKLLNTYSATIRYVVVKTLASMYCTSVWWLELQGGASITTSTYTPLFWTSLFAAGAEAAATKSVVVSSVPPELAEAKISFIWTWTSGGSSVPVISAPGLTARASFSLWFSTEVLSQTQSDFEKLNFQRIWWLNIYGMK